MVVTLISTPEEMPSDPSSVVVLVREEPTSAAAEVVERLGCEPPCAPAEAMARLDARRHEDHAAGDGPADRTGDRAADYERALRAAREEAAEALARVPPLARRVDPERLHAAAAAVGAAEVAVGDAGVLLGERPELAAEAAQAALAAEEAVVRAHQQRSVGIDRAATLLLGANAAGLLIVAGRVRTPVVEPLFVFVAALPLVALAYLVATAVSRTREARAAARLRSQALQRTGMATMTGLVARSARVKAWSVRADALAAAEASLAQARRRWAGLAGDTAPTQVGNLVRALAEAQRTAAALAELEAAPIVAVPQAPGHLVILVDGAADDPLDEDARALLDRLDQMEGVDPQAATVVVTASAAVGSWAAARSGGHAGAQVVDIRERVLASLERLRARASSFADTTPPGPMAADG